MGRRALAVGDRVRALVQQTEEDFAGRALHVHAAVGAFGVVQGVDGDIVNVTWEASGTTDICAAEELEPAPWEDLRGRLGLATVVGLALSGLARMLGFATGEA